MNKYIKTHRCPASLWHHISIRYMTDSFIESRNNKWVIMHQEYDPDYNVTYMAVAVVGAKYCPYCGERLEE